MKFEIHNLKKLLLLIIGLLSLSPAAFAQSAAEDCSRTLFSSEFHCTRRQVSSYCDATVVEAVREAANPYSFYKNIYCEVSDNVDEDIYEIVAEQMEVEDPKYNDEDLIKYILEDIGRLTIQEFLVKIYGNEGLDKLPKEIREAFIEERDFTKQNQIYQKIRAAFDREKIMHQTQASLKRELKAREMWADGSLDNSPFDLIVDLNLIEIVLFGSLATWTDDVWSFPDEDDIGLEGFATSSSDDAADDDLDSDEDGDEDEVDPNTDPTNPDNYECVPDEDGDGIPDDSEGDSGDNNPEEDIDPAEIPPGCGNGQIDFLELCDDGNNVAGDGCSQVCTLEDGNSLSCQDPEAVTFKPFEPDSGSGGPQIPPGFGGGNNPPGGGLDPNAPDLGCPPGTTQRLKPELLDLDPFTVPQAANYPGPFIGGVLKQFPQSTRPACEVGWSPISVKLPDIDLDTSEPSLDVSSTTKALEALRCIPTELCADFDDIKEFLFGPDYQDNPVAEAIESLVCIKVTEVMRPESPYSLNEGCIDCHIRGMADTLEEMLEKNVAPLENSMSAWGISNRWGPSFSFDLVTSVRTHLRFTRPSFDPVTLDSDLVTRARNLIQDSSNRLDPNKPAPEETITAVGEAFDILSQSVDKKTKQEIQIKEGLQSYLQTAESQYTSPTTNNDIIPLLNQWHKSFQRLQDKYVGLASATEFHEKNLCTF